MKATRRDLLKGTVGSTIIAATGMVAVPMLAAQSNPDAHIFDLIEEHGCAARLIKAANGRLREAFQEALPPRVRAVEYLDLSPKDRGLVLEAMDRPSIQPLYAETRRLKDECRAVVERLSAPEV